MTICLICQVRLSLVSNKVIGDYSFMALIKRPVNPLTLVLVLSALFFVVFLVISAALFMSSSSKTSKGMGASLFSQGAVAIVEVNGVIMDSKKVLAKLEKYEEDDNVKAIVLRLNSPGGAVAPSQEIYQAVRASKKPIVASMGSVAASGAYYIACGAKKIYANPGTITGSIGVIMEFANLQKLYEWAKIERYALKTGKFKDAGAEYRQMTAEERALLQTMIDDVLGQFKKAVAEGRKMTLSEVSLIADGRIVSGNQAKLLRLIDELGTLKDAIDEAGKMANIKGKPRIIHPEKKRPKWFDLLFDDRGSDDDGYASTSNGNLVKFFDKFVQEKVVGLAPGIYWLWPGAR